MTVFVASAPVDLNTLNEFSILNSSNIGSAAFSGDTTSIAVSLDNIEIDFTGTFSTVVGAPTQDDLSAGTDLLNRREGRWIP